MTAMKSGMRPATEAERKALGVPPAYSHVMVAEDPNADLLATARIPNGKTYYKYSKYFVERSADKKWKRVRALAKKAERVVQRIEKDSEDGLPVAMTARLILLTGMRNGGAPQGTICTESYGASSLLLKHCTVDGSTVRFQFPGKKNVPQDVAVADKVLADYVRERKRVSEDFVRLFAHNAGATLRYMKSIGASKVHDLRTWKANELANALLTQLLAQLEEVPSTAKAVKQLQKAIAQSVASSLGNTASVTLKSYIDPRTWSPLSLKRP